MSSRVVGHEEQRRRLSQAWKAGRLAHAYIFAGPSGVGKRTFVREFAKALLCQRPNIEALEPCGECSACKVFEADGHPDYLEAAKEDDRNEFRIDVIRELLPKFSLKPALGDRRAAIVDDAETFNEEAANAFLKTLEEPPPGSTLILIASSVAGLLPTIRSRCQFVAFSPLSTEETAEVLLRTGTAKSIDEARSLAALSDGSISDIEELLDDEWRELQPQLLERLSAPSFDLVRFGKDVNKFCENAGKDAAPKRRRATLIVRTALLMFQDAIRAQATGEAVSNAAATRAANALGPESLLDAVDRTLLADEQIKRYLHLPTVVDCWLDDIAQIAVGAYSPSV